jgi:hypothetical protein
LPPLGRCLQVIRRRRALGNHSAFHEECTRLAHVIRFIPRPRLRAAIAADPHAELGLHFGTPYAIQREVLFSPLGVPCNPPPWGMLTVVDLNARTVAGTPFSARLRSWRRCRCRWPGARRPSGADRDRRRAGIHRRYG